MSDAIDQMYVEFLASYDSLDSAPEHVGAIFADISASADESSSSISDSFALAGDAAQAFAEMSQMAAENAATAMGDVAPATGEIDSAFADMASSVTLNITDIDVQVTEMAAHTEEASATMAEATSGVSSSFMDLFNKIGFGIFNFQNYANIAKQVAGALLGPAISAETVTTALTTLDGSAKAAADEMAKLNAFAAKTPFKTLDIDQAAEELQGFGIKAGDVIPDITAIGDALGSVGRDTPAELDSVVQIFGKIHTEGKITQMTMNELAVHGINGWQALADATGKTIPQVKEMVKKGLIPADEAISLLTKGIEMNPLYKGGMAKAAGTFTGLMSTLLSNWNQVVAAFGTPIIKALEGDLNKLGTILASPAFQAFAGKVGQGIVNVFKDIGGGVSNVIDYFKAFDLTGITHAFHQLGDAVGKIIGPFTSIGSNKAASGFFSTLKADLSQGIVKGIEIVSDSIKGLADLFNDLGTILASPSFQSFAGSVGKGIATVFKDLKSDLTSGITTGIKDVSGFIRDLAGDFIKLGSNKDVIGFLTTIKTGFQQLVQIVGGQLGQNFQLAGKEIQQVGQWFKADMLPAIQQALPGFEHLGSVVITDVVPALAKIWAVGQQVERDVMPLLIQAFETIAPIVVKVAGFLADNLGTAIHNIMPDIVGAADAFGHFAEGIVSRVEPIVQDIWTLLSDFLNWIGPYWPTIWGGISSFFGSTWQTIKGIVQVGWSLISGIINVGLDIMSGNWGKAWDDIKSALSGAWDGIKNIAQGAFGGLWGIIKTGLNDGIGLVNTFIDNLDRIHVSLPGGASIGFSLPHIPYLAAGGDVAPGGVAVAGEAGPELVFGGTSGAHVLSSAASMGMLQQAGGKTEIHNHIYIDGRELSNSLMVQVLSEIRGAGHPIGVAA